jgi:hypothetical protein
MTSPNDFSKISKAKKALLEEWLLHVKTARAAHYETARYYRRWNYILGLPTIALSVVVSSAILSRLASLSIVSETWAILLAGFLSVLVTIATALQTFFGFSGNAERHRGAGAEYGAIMRRIEAAKERLDEDKDLVDIEFRITLVDMIKDIEERMDRLGERAPTVPPSIFNKYLAKLPENQPPPPSKNPSPPAT